MDSPAEIAVVVTGKTRRAVDVVELELRSTDGTPLPAWQPGAHIDLVLEGIPTRQYSLCGDPGEPAVWHLGILRDPAGRGSSRHVHDTLQVGDVVHVCGPRNHFPLVPSPRYLFIAGGIGITPILPMTAAAEAAGADWRLVYGGRQRSSMGFLDALARFGDRVALHPQDETGLLDLTGLLGEPEPETLIYCCGPEPLLAAVEDATAAWPTHALHVERFRAKPLVAPARADSFDVVLEQSGRTVTVRPDQSILETVEAAGVRTLSSCREGTCGTCETKVLAGIVDHRDSLLDDDERAANDCMMICVSRSLGPRLVLDL
jgi:ferredoxin-NADP reductase